MGENSFAFNSFIVWNFPNICFTDELTFRLCTHPEKFAFLTLKINVVDVKNSIWLPDIKINFILKFRLKLNKKRLGLHMSFICKEVFHYFNFIWLNF